MPKPDPKDERAEKRRRMFGLLLLTAIASFKVKADTLLDSFAQTRDAKAFAAAYVEILVELHTQASFAGRGVAATFTGKAVELGDVDIHFATHAVHEQADRIGNLRRDIETGRYNRTGEDGESTFDPEKVKPRIDLYANRANGTANDSMVRSLPKEEDGYIRWVLGEDEDHCDDCPRWAAGGLYTPDTLPAVPGDGTSACKTNCLCHLEVYGIPVPMLGRP